MGIGFKKGRRIVASANFFPESASMLVGVRHWDTRMREQYQRNKCAFHGKEIQGFLDNKGVFLGREEAWLVAEAAGQILFEDCWNTIGDKKVLYSENVW